MKKSKCAVAILENNTGGVLLYLRSNIPDIAFPNTWSLFGGLVEMGEAPASAIKRELEEELKFIDGKPYKLHDPCFLGIYKRRDIHREEYVYKALLLESPETLILHEGQYMKLFNKSMVENSDNVAPHHKEILLQYFNKKSSLPSIF